RGEAVVRAAGAGDAHFGLRALHGGELATVPLLTGVLLPPGDHADPSLSRSVLASHTGEWAAVVPAGGRAGRDRHQRRVDPSWRRLDAREEWSANRPAVAGVRSE